ncbi:molybdenum cofactor biosynthesis protein MoaE [Devosia sp. 63-57]|uniref:molybdenum cofactor biosynthesis protein MoaE n=1 Tax=Devosia sp. 63-57 TaxID=1895751 RepID=UPI00086AB5DB|nr:molybdenum cofactor biosynthesis protein MoaE [Devosia sp. 63-57]ODT49611.1 MAG: molybdenum cofactor biosynthesis protein MoaE [Pelagibacterium sp. SCN 63-126]ODU87625.1 MAG: molybdenum cofactor biosynthesis protein MoaE [Pelagibacterium sp. SCN 63-17]OJX45626.1 MAG: molybdenum cofactor biosynthesis protein MoaE [Devosia sp. 63-57]
MIRVTEDRFDPGQEANDFQAAHLEAGAMVTFTGLVRSHPEAPISALILECYPQLAENEIAALREQAIQRFGLADAGIIHRYGRLVPGEPIMMVMTLSAHRQAAFDAAQFLMDYLKTDAPFWKQEETPAGLQWVAAKAEDDNAQQRWSQ